MPYIGIDFGTSNSVVANFQYGQAEVVPNHEGLKWTPSIVTLRRDGTLAFGQEAKENFDEQRSIRSIKRILGTPERVPLVGQNLRTEQIAVMLFSLLKRDAEKALGESFTKGVGKLGGDDLDLALAKVLAERFQQKNGYDILNSPYKQQFMLAVEKAKIDLSTEPITVARKAELVPERHLSLEEEIDRPTFERAIMPLSQQSGAALDEAMKLRNLRPKDIDKVLLVGGTSKIPIVQRYVTEKMAGKESEPFDQVDPMTCVAQGAAIVSAILQDAPGLDHYAYSVKLEHSLCANPINERRQVYLDPIVKRGVDIPCSFTKIYHPVADPAERVIISVFEGDVYDDPNHPENVKLAEIPWEFQPPRSQRDGSLDVRFEYGDDGILTVQIHDTHAKQKKRFPIQQAGEDQMDAAQVIKMKRINEDLIAKSADLESTAEYKDALEVLKKTEQDVIHKLDKEEDRRELEELCRQVRLAMGSGDQKKMESASAELNDRLLNYAYLL